MGEKAVEDYSTSFHLLKNIADYITLNISCPNTAEGKTFEEPETLNRLLQTLEIGKDSSLPAVLIKFSVDLEDRKSTRLNSSHVAISYAVFCLKKKNQNK